MSNQIPEPVKKPVVYKRPSLPKGYTKEFFNNRKGDIHCVIRNEKGVDVGSGTARLNPLDKDVANNALGKTIAMGRAYKNWQGKSIKGKFRSVTLNGQPINTGSLTVSISGGIK